MCAIFHHLLGVSAEGSAVQLSSGPESMLYSQLFTLQAKGTVMANKGRQFGQALDAPPVTVTEKA